MRTVCGQFCGIFGGFFGSCWATLARALSVPGRSFVLGARNCTAEGNEPVFALLKFAFFLFFPHFLSFPKRFEHGRFSCKGGRDMASKIPTMFAISCNRPSALWASQPSLLSCSLLSTFLLRFPPFSQMIFAYFSAFLRTFKKNRVLFGETPKKEGLRVHVIRTPVVFFR